jgi:CRISPR-associated exonuclease Cas4
MNDVAFYAEAELLPLSGLAHMAFCERRWSLVHLEQQWQENRFTVEGTHLHEKAHSAEVESRPGVLIRRTLPLRSLRLGLSGQADVVEFLPSTETSAIALNDRPGRWQLFPIEYKRSRDKAGSIAFRLQLCAQAICLEEMLGAAIPAGAVYDASKRRRMPVAFLEPVRREVERLAARMHQLHQLGLTPHARLIPACRNCSLKEQCLPAVMDTAPAVAAYMRRMLRDEQ